MVSFSAVFALLSAKVCMSLIYFGYSVSIFALGSLSLRVYEGESLFVCFAFAACTPLFKS